MGILTQTWKSNPLPENLNASTFSSRIDSFIQGYQGIQIIVFGSARLMIGKKINNAKIRTE